MLYNRADKRNTSMNIDDLMALARKACSQANIDTIQEYPSELVVESLEALHSALRAALAQPAAEPDLDPMPYGHQDITDNDPGPAAEPVEQEQFAAFLERERAVGYRAGFEAALRAQPAAEHDEQPVAAGPDDMAIYKAIADNYTNSPVLESALRAALAQREEV